MKSRVIVTFLGRPIEISMSKWKLILFWIIVCLFYGNIYYQVPHESTINIKDISWIVQRTMKYLECVISVIQDAIEALLVGQLFVNACAW